MWIILFFSVTVLCNSVLIVILLVVIKLLKELFANTSCNPSAEQLQKHVQAPQMIYRPLRPPVGAGDATDSPVALSLIWK